MCTVFAKTERGCLQNWENTTGATNHPKSSQISAHQNRGFLVHFDESIANQMKAKISYKGEYRVKMSPKKAQKVKMIVQKKLTHLWWKVDVGWCHGPSLHPPVIANPCSWGCALAERISASSNNTGDPIRTHANSHTHAHTHHTHAHTHTLISCLLFTLAVWSVWMGSDNCWLFAKLNTRSEKTLVDSSHSV